MLLDKQVSVIFLFECKMGCKAQETTHNINTFGPKHHFEVSSSLILCNNKELILEWIVTCDEKGINKLQRTSHSQTCTVKRSCSLFEGMLGGWSTTALWILWNHCIWEVGSAHWSDSLETAAPAVSFGQQKGPSSPWQHPAAHCPTSASDVEWIELQSWVSSP